MGNIAASWALREGGAITAAHIRLARVLVVVSRWSIDMNVIFVTSCVLCTAMLFDKYIKSFPQKIAFIKLLTKV